MSESSKPTEAAQIAVLADMIEDLYYHMAWHDERNERNECYQQVHKLRAVIPKAVKEDSHG
jgi:hypothetical protein